MSGARGGGRAWSAPPPSPADIGLVAALPIEVAPLLRKLERVRKYSGRRLTVVEGELSGKLVVAVTAGPGRQAAARGAETLIDGHRPRWLISAGFGGALDPALRFNDVVLVNEVLDPEGGRFAIDVRLPETSGSTGFRAGTLLTVDEIARTAAEKAELRRRFGADVVDMETAAVAAVCAARGVRLLAIRVISDDAGADLPREVATILARSGSMRLGAAVGAIWRRPSSLGDLLALRERAHQTADRLDMVVRAAIASLP